MKRGIIYIQQQDGSGRSTAFALLIAFLVEDEQENLISGAGFLRTGYCPSQLLLCAERDKCQKNGNGYAS
jgi:hypothetical protein